MDCKEPRDPANTPKPASTSPTTDAGRLLADPVYATLKNHVIRTTGLDYYATRDDELCATVNRRIAELSLDDCRAYLKLIAEPAAGQPERDRLVEALTIGETFLFRHSEMFDALRDRVLPELIERNRDSRRLRIWSAGCSVGAEPYSISLLLKRELSHALHGWDVAIVGTDINRKSLNRARTAVFEDWALRSVPPKVRDECLLFREGAWELAPQYREGVRFQYHNLVDDPFDGPEGAGLFDLILCRNVMIYFSRDRIAHVIDGLHNCLARGGWLLVGYAEPHVELFRKFETVNVPGAVLYQKPSAAAQRDRLAADDGRVVGRRSSAEPTNRPSRIAAAPNPLAARNGKATQRRFAGSPTGGIQKPAIDRSPEADPEHELTQRLAAIRALLSEGSLAPARDACRELLRTFKLDAEVHFHHGLVLNEMHLENDALQAFKRAIYLDREHAAAHYRLGLIHRGLGRGKLAARSFRTVRELLVRRNAEQIVDGLTVAELNELAASQLGECVRT